MMSKTANRRSRSFAARLRAFLSGPRLGWLLALLSVTIFSTNTPVARAVILQDMQPLTLVVSRFVGAALLFGFTMLVTPLGRAKGEEAPLNRRIILICLLSGGINGFTLTAYYSALSYVSASLTAVLGIAMFPSMTLIILAIGGEKLTRRRLLRLSIALLGIYLLLGLSGRIDPIGLLLIFVAATTYAMHIVSVQWYMKPYNTWAVASLMISGSAVVVVILWLVSGTPRYVPGAIGWLVIAYQIVILTFVGRTVIYAAIDRIGSGQMALLTPIETVLTIVWSALFLDEVLTTNQLIGATLILISALLAGEFRRARSVPDVP